MIEVFEEEIETDELLELLDENEWMELRIRATLGGALSDMRSELEL